jgi:glutaredoxin
MYLFMERLANLISSPEPYVVEINLHPHGRELQDYLGQYTGRRTVPNVLLNGESIGGGDEMRAFEAAGTVARELLEKLHGKITIDGQGVA